MEFVLFFAFSVLAAIGFNALNPKIMATKWAQDPRAAGYAGRTLFTAVSFFLVLIAAGFVVGLADKGGAARPPTA